MLGRGLEPMRSHPIAPPTSDRGLGALVERIRGDVERTVAQLPPQQRCVDHCGGATGR